MAMPVAGDTVRHSAILDIRGWATAVARASQRYLQLALNHRLDELTHTLTQPDFDRVKPIVEKMDRRLCFRLQDRRRRASLAHGVVSTGAPTPGLLWVSPPGDYAIINSNHIPDGTVRRLQGDKFRSPTHIVHTRAPPVPRLCCHRWVVPALASAKLNGGNRIKQHAPFLRRENSQGPPLLQ